MKLIDSHCHLNFSEFKADRDYLISQAESIGICKWLVPSVSVSDWPEIHQLSLQYPQVYAALGIHPWYVTRYPLSSLFEIKSLHSSYPETIIAIGETGLDRLKPDWDKQCRYFEAHLELADDLNLPVVIHNVKAQEAVLKIWRSYPKLSGVIHGFSGSLEQAEQLIAHRLYIGIGGSITYERARKTRLTAASLPLEYLLVETDAPSMPLSGFQGELNKPGQLRAVFDCLCSLRKETPQQIAQQLWINSHSLFKMSRPN